MATSDRLWIPTPPKDPPDGPYTLEIDRENLFNHNYIDPEGRVAFRVYVFLLVVCPDCAQTLTSTPLIVDTQGGR